MWSDTCPAAGCSRRSRPRPGSAAGPRFVPSAIVPIRFVRSVSAPARLAGRPARLVTAAHLCYPASAPNPCNRCVPRWPIPRRDLSRRVRRVRPGPPWPPGLNRSSGVTHPSRPIRAVRVAAPASDARARRPGPGSSCSLRRPLAGPSWGVVCARALVPRASVPRPATCSGLVRQSVPRAGG